MLSKILELDPVKLYVSNWTKVSVGLQNGWNSTLHGHKQSFEPLDLNSKFSHANTQLSDECIHS